MVTPSKKPQEYSTNFLGICGNGWAYSYYIPFLQEPDSTEALGYFSLRERNVWVLEAWVRALGFQVVVQVLGGVCLAVK